MAFRPRTADIPEGTPSLSTGSSDVSNPWSGKGVGRPGFDCTGWASSVDSEGKVSLLRSACKGGYCYIWIVLLIDALQVLSLTEFTNFIGTFKSTCGSKPDGSKMITELIALSVKQFGDVGTGLSANIISTSLIDHMLGSKVRLTYEDNGMIHLKPVNVYSFGCNCGEVFCEHGWAARFILSIILKKGLRVGATIDFAALDGFELHEDVGVDDPELESYSDDHDHYKHQTFMKPQPLKPNTNHSIGQEQRRAQQDRVPEPSMRNISEIDDLVRLTKMAEEAIGKSDRFSSFNGNESSSMKRKLARNLEKKISALNSELEGYRIKSEIGPEDSSSNFDRRNLMNGRYLTPGTILGDRSSGLSARSQPLMRTENLHVVNPILGYLKTSEMIDREASAVSGIGSINGLTNPFKDERLSLLIHLHTALGTFKIKTEQPESLYKGLLNCVKSRPRSSSEKLLKEVLNATFDLDRYEIVSNPYRLPYVEVGMRISGGQMVKTFNLLYREYEIKWFDCMKGLRIPEFHSEFYNVSERDPRPDSRVSTSGNERSKKSRHKSGSSSFLSYLHT